jgi:3-hydroxy acid dehydrogenase / malonic semialdehyde reductase
MPDTVAVEERTTGLRGLKDKNVLITGGSSGIGQAIAVRFAEYGANVAINYLTQPEEGAETEEQVQACVAKVQQEGVRDVLVGGDVSKEDDVERMTAEAVEQLGGLDILVNNAGGARGRYPFWESSEEDEEWMIETNVHGLMRMTRLCLPHIRDGGHIVNIDSIAGRAAYENAAVYCAVKAASAMFSQALREDLLGRPIRVTALAPGMAETEFSLVRFKGDEEKARKVYEGVEPLTAEDIADCVMFALTRPLHVNVDEIVVKMLAQTSGGRILRNA